MPGALLASSLAAGAETTDADVRSEFESDLLGAAVGIVEACADDRGVVVLDEELECVLVGRLLEVEEVDFGNTL